MCEPPPDFFAAVFDESVATRKRRLALVKQVTTYRSEYIAPAKWAQHFLSGVEELKSPCFNPAAWTPLYVLERIVGAYQLDREYGTDTFQFLANQQDSLQAAFDEARQPDGPAIVADRSVLRTHIGSPLAWPQYAMAETYQQIVRMPLDQFIAYATGVLKTTLTAHSLAGATTRAAMHGNLEVALAIKKRNRPLPPGARRTHVLFYRTGASSARTDPFARPEAQLTKVDGAWQGKAGTCALFARYAEAGLVEDYVVTIIGFAPMADGKNAFRLERVLLTDPGSMAASVNVHGGGTHNPLREKLVRCDEGV